MSPRLCLAFALLGALTLPAPTAEAQWTQFRGSNAGDVGDDPRLPDTWSVTENVVWSIDVPGLSWSSPVVWENTIFVTSAISAGEEPAPIPGLYAAGEMVGGLFFFNYPGGTGLTSGSVFGRMAGTSAGEAGMG